MNTLGMTDDQAIYLLEAESTKRKHVPFMRASTIGLNGTQLRRLAREGRIRRMRIPVTIKSKERDAFAPVIG